MDEYIEREAAVEAAKHAWGKGLEPTQYIEIIPAADVVSRSAFDQIIDRLSKYEATGMTPEEIMSASNRRHDCKIDCLLKEYNALKEKLDKVVRCKDCKFWDFGDCYRLELSRPDDFCSYGERKAE